MVSPPTHMQFFGQRCIHVGSFLNWATPKKAVALSTVAQMCTLNRHPSDVFNWPDLTATMHT